MTRAPTRETPFALLFWSVYPGARTVTVQACLLFGVWLCELSIPLLMGGTVDAAMSRTGDLAVLIRYGTAACLVAALLYILHRAYLRAETRLVARGTFRLRRHLYSRILEQPLPCLPNSRTGEIAQRLMSDTDVLDTHAIYLLADAPFCAMTVFGIFTVMLWMQAQLAVIVLAILVSVAVLSNHAAGPLPTMERVVRHRWARLGGRLQETLDGLRTVKIFGRETRETAALDGAGTRLMQSEIALGTVIARLEPLSQLMATAGFLSVVCCGSILVYRGMLSPGRMVAFIAYMQLICEPIRDAGAHYAHYRQSVGTLGRMADYLTQLVRPLPKGKSAVSGPVNVELHDIHFTYPGAGRKILNGVSLGASSGEIVAITGDNGAGKSTLMDVLLGLLRPQRGQVRIGGIPLDSWDCVAWRAATAVVPQMIFMFRATLEENIRYGDPDATRAEVASVIELAGLAELVARLPRGLDTIVGNGGETLSGGERQRVGLARALLRKPRLLVLDEPTSALDAAALPNFSRVLHQGRNGRVTFVVSHDPRVITLADRIILLRGGRIALTCSPSETGKLDEIFGKHVRPQLEGVDVMAQKIRHPFGADLGGFQR